jgi:hypothetical protein
MNDLRIFMWAAMHHPDFNLCLVNLPIRFQIFTNRPHRYSPVFVIRLYVHRFDISLPWTVKDDYWRSQGIAPYSDIPF